MAISSSTFFWNYFVCLEVRLKFPFSDAQIDIVVEETVKKTKRTRNRGKLSAIMPPTPPQTPPPVVGTVNAVGEVVSSEVIPEVPSSKEQSVPPVDNGDKAPILMVEVVNVQHEKFKRTEEVKVILVFKSLSKMYVR